MTWVDNHSTFFINNYHIIVFIHDIYIYFPIYEPTTGTNVCKTGNAILKAFDSKCGNTVLNVNLGKGVASKVVVNNNNLYIGIAGEADKNISGFTSKDNLITGKSEAKGGGGAITVEGWKEN